MLSNRIGVVSLLLTFVAGFTDTTTFVAADRLFSAHVTGNFVVLAYDLVVGADRSAYIKLLAFPVFVGAVMLAGRYDRKRKGSNPAGLMQLEGAMLLLAALVILLLQWVFPDANGLRFVAQMLIIMAMGFQNACNRLYAAATYGPTTVMTGNVTAAALDVVQGFMARPRDEEKIAHFNRNLKMIGAFLFGCLCGGFSAHRWGLIVVVAPGLLVLVTARRIAAASAKKGNLPVEQEKP
ncbi:YoaK family protein [Puia dinghuensis]|uniref:DUF1275 domain-containing protein n=1 Tax=Puia dinghuensis TaxID=1792502 RepID=A0A8J2XVW8_9BACT|nr:YoaK family protein [Puia dinghuensis]GGB19561.1 hypothetical protein GCM10011511_49110 [Puia dinghuensis]